MSGVVQEGEEGERISVDLNTEACEHLALLRSGSKQVKGIGTRVETFIREVNQRNLVRKPRTVQGRFLVASPLVKVHK